MTDAFRLMDDSGAALTVEDLLALPRIPVPADDSVVTCSYCSRDLDGVPDDDPCDANDDVDDGEVGCHSPDQELHDPPEDKPERGIVVEFKLTVPNDGYDYHTDVVGRLERTMTLLLLDPYVTRVETGGPSGSGWICDVEADDAAEGTVKRPAP